MAKNEVPSNVVQTLVKGLNILEFFANDVDEKGIQEMSNIIGLPESTIHRILNTLEYKGYIMQNPSNKKYRLGLKFLTVSNKITNMEKWLDVAKENMETLNQKCNETVNLAIRDENMIIYITKVDSTHVLRPNFIVGDYFILLIVLL